jgi:hypothetical protein
MVDSLIFLSPWCCRFPFGAVDDLDVAEVFVVCFVAVVFADTTVRILRESSSNPSSENDPEKNPVLIEARSGSILLSVSRPILLTLSMVD